MIAEWQEVNIMEYNKYYDNSLSQDLGEGRNEHLIVAIQQDWGNLHRRWHLT